MESLIDIIKKWLIEHQTLAAIYNAERYCGPDSKSKTIDGKIQYVYAHDNKRTIAYVYADFVVLFYLDNRTHLMHSIKAHDPDFFDELEKGLLSRHYANQHN